jgi:hypothetical protein
VTLALCAADGLFPLLCATTGDAAAGTPAPEFVDQLVVFVERFGAFFALLFGFGGWAITREIQRRRWKSKTFVHEVNISLNDVVDDTLHLRTLRESLIDRIWLNESAANLVRNWAAKTTEERPFIVLPAHMKSDMEYVKRAVINALSETMAPTFIARATGVAVPTAEFIFGITYERYGALPTRKLRVMVARRDLLESRFAPAVDESESDKLKVLAETHRDRIRTLRAMARMLQSADPAEQAALGTLELGVPVSR